MKKELLADIVNCVNTLLMDLGDIPSTDIAGEDPYAQMPADPGSVMSAIAEPLIMADFWDEDMDPRRVEGIIKSMRGFQSLYNVDISGLIEMLSTYVEMLREHTDGKE